MGQTELSAPTHLKIRDAGRPRASPHSKLTKSKHHWPREKVKEAKTNKRNIVGIFWFIPIATKTRLESTCESGAIYIQVRLTASLTLIKQCTKKPHPHRIYRWTQVWCFLWQHFAYVTGQREARAHVDAIGFVLWSAANIEYSALLMLPLTIATIVQSSLFWCNVYFPCFFLGVFFSTWLNSDLSDQSSMSSATWASSRWLSRPPSRDIWVLKVGLWACVLT